MNIKTVFAIFVAIAMVAPLAAASQIYPEYICWEHNGNDGYTTHWRYVNFREAGYEIPYGADNNMSGGGQEGPGMGQPTQFPVYGQPGEEFTIETDGSKVVWILDGKRIAGGMVTKTERECPGNDHDVPEFGGIAALATVGLAGAALVAFKRN